MATIGTGGTRPTIPKIVKPFIPKGTGGTSFVQPHPAYDAYKGNKGSMTYAQWRQSGSPKNPVKALGASGPDPGKVLAPVEEKPIDPIYNQGTEDSAKIYKDSLRQTEADRQSFADASGYNANGTINDTNPFSRRIALAKAYERAQLRTNQEAAQRGQFNSGSTQADLGYNTEQNMEQNYNFTGDRLNQNTAFTGRDLGAGATQTETNRRLYNDSLTRGLANPALDLTPKVEAENQGGSKVNTTTGQLTTNVKDSFGGPQMAKEFNRLKPEDQKGYQQYLSQAQKSGIKALLPWAWKAKGPGYAPTSVKGNAFGGRQMAVQFNQLSGSDQKAYQSYLAESSNNNQTALLPLKWAKQKKGV